MMSNRYVKVSRKFFESVEWLLPRTFSEQEAWLDMIFLACFANHQIDLGKDGILHLERGEFYYPQRQLAKRWGWPLSKVNRYLARLAEGTNPRIEKIMRETQNETQSETQVETQIAVVKLCNYARYNKASSESETHIETHIETQNETLNKKGYNNKGDKNTHTHYSSLKDLFVHASTHAHEGAEICERACKACEELLLYCGHDAEAMAEHKTWVKSNPLHFAMVEMYRCYPTLQQHFRKPLLPSQMRELMRMYDIADIWRIIEAIDNKRERIKGASLFQTIKQWATTDIVLANRRREQLQQYS